MSLDAITWIPLLPAAAPARVSAAPVLAPLPLIGDGAQLAAGAVPRGPSAFDRAQRQLFRALIWVGNRSPLAEKAGLGMIGALQRVKDTPQPQNFGQVAPGIYRGAQPGPTTLRALQQMGIRTVINLTRESNHDARWIGPTGMRYVYMPEDPFDAPTMEQALRFLALVQDPANQPVFFHCYHGSDRTGTMAAVYRIAHDGWTVDQCLEEMGRYGFHANFEQAKARFLEQFYQYWHGRRG